MTDENWAGEFQGYTYRAWCGGAQSCRMVRLAADALEPSIGSTHNIGA